MNHVEISVYITNYNYGSFIEDSIKSILKQTFKNFEVIIVDDGSTDNSKLILSKYLKHKKIKNINQKNQGLIKSCNTAIKAANGRFVMRLDADDYLKKNALENFYKKINSNREIGLVFSDYYIIDNNKNIIKKNRTLNFDKKVKLLDIPAHGACSLIRKEYLYDANLYDEDFDRQDGYDLWLKFYKRYKVSNINKPLWYYRQHNSSLSRNEYELLKTRSKIYDKFVTKNLKLNKKCACVIPVRGSKIYNQCLSDKKLNKKPLIFYTIDQALNSKKIDKVILSTSDVKLIKLVKKKYKNKIFLHKRSEDLSIENTFYRDAVISAVKSVYKKKDPDYLLILNFEYPLRESFYIDKAINSIQIFNTDKLISTNVNVEDHFYSHDGKGLKLISNSKHETLQFEKKLIYIEVGGISVYKYLNYKKKSWFKKSSIGHIIIDRVSAFKISNKNDLNFAKYLYSLRE